MIKLVILQVFDPLAGMPDKELILDTEFETEGQAELRALRWLMYRPNDIITYLTLETGACKHCKKPIHEKEGWVVHKWVHDGGYMACLPDGATQAEPL